MLRGRFDLLKIEDLLFMYSLSLTRRTMPISLFVGVPLVAVCYILINVAFFIVLTYSQILSADAVALVRPS